MCPSEESISDRPVAVVLGASRGLGFLVAGELLRRGHRVVVAARDLAEVEAAVRDGREVEDDPSFKQIIPYVVFRSGDLVFCYTRGGSQGESARPVAHDRPRSSAA